MNGNEGLGCSSEIKNNIKQEPPEDYFLCLPKVEEDQEDLIIKETHWVDHRSNVKQEPPEEFFLILPETQEFEETEQIKEEVQSDHELSEVIIKYQPEVNYFPPELVKIEDSSKSESTKEEKVTTKLKKSGQKSVKRERKSSTIKNLKKLDLKFLDDRFQCDICGVSYTRKQTLKDHIRKNHLKSILGAEEKGLKKFICNTCNQCYSYLRSFNEHQKFHKHGIYSDTPDEKFFCSECGKSFGMNRHLKRHISRSHSKKPSQCKFCQKSFKSSHNLRQHVKTHNKIKCKICSEEITNDPRFLRHHMKSHLGKGKYECELCLKTFSFQSNIKCHIERMHLDGKYGCGVFRCKEKFLSPEEAFKHLKIHIAISQYKCPICGGVERTKKLFEHHMALQHQLKFE